MDHAESVAQAAVSGGAFQKYVPFFIGASVLFGLYLTSLYSYNLFHSLAELFSIAVAWSIFMIAWNSRRVLDNNYLLLVGIAYLFVGAVDMLHTLAYKGMGVFTGFDANLPTQLWITGRYLQSTALLIAPFFINRRLSNRIVITCYAAVTTLLLGSIFYWKIFPDCFIEGPGLTPFKKISEYVIVAILFTSLVFLRAKRSAFDPRVLRLLVFSVLATAASELMFTFYISVYGISNLVGHFLKIFAFYFIYKAVIETGIITPYDLIFRKLKQSEGALQNANEELEHRASELEEVNKELEAFCYSVSHDLKAPLRSIDGFSKAVLEDYAGRLDTVGQDYLNRVRAASTRMSELIDHLLMVSRVSRCELRHEPVDLSALALAVRDELVREQPERAVEFVVFPCLTVKGDPLLLRTVIENLLGNAWKFTGKQPLARIEFGSLQSDGETVYFVRDDGAGFDMTYVGKMFAPFQRLHAASEFAGTGIGLATVKRIIHRHGGRIWAEGAPGKGATFYFSLPQVV